MDPSRAVPVPIPSLPGGGADLEGLRRQAEDWLEHPLCRALLASIPGHAMLLDRERRLLAASRELRERLALQAAPGQGRMPAGEIFRCIQVKEGPGGCGSLENCLYRGDGLPGAEAPEGILARECTFGPAPGPLGEGEVFQLRSTPFSMDGQDLLLFLLQDVSLEKRQEALQHIFFHDLLNLVEGLEGVACGLLEEPSRAERTACQIRDLSCQLSEEVQNQRVLLSAEEGCLVADTHPTRPSDILDRVRLVFARNEVAQGRRLVILPGPQGVFPTDPVLLTRVLVNLVKNAFEATPRGGTVKVWHLWREGERGFAVENPGAIPSEVAGHIFQRSYSTKGSPGRGMGTYGAKLLGERFLGGRVEFSCAEGATRFTVWVPDGGNPPPREPEGEESVVEILPAPMPEPEAGTCGGATVLVIDDSRTVRRLLGNILGKHYRVLLAENGEEGLVLATEEGPDLILLDVLMPGLDGFAVCSRLKGDSRTRDIPVLFLTALSGAVDEMRALEAGAIDFIPKPISPAILGARVRNHLDLKRYQDKLRNLSLLDGLTGIANRRRFDQYLELEWQRCSRNGQPLSLVLGDVDVFKAYNDGYGHGQGDDCLRRVAEVFQASLRRPADLAARYGGEEFVCILPETGREGARSVADQIMARMADLDLPHAFSPVAGRVTVSLGLATAELPVSAESWGGLLEQADRRLYLAKSRGRNRMEGP